MKSAIQRLKEMEQEAIEAGLWPGDKKENSDSDELKRLRAAVKEASEIVEALSTVVASEWNIPEYRSRDDIDIHEAQKRAREWLEKYGGEE